MKRLALGVAATVTVWHATITVAFAAGQGERVGENIGNLLGGWAKELFVGIAAIACLVFLLNRKFQELAVFLVAAIVVGGFVFAPDQVAGTIRDMWRTITA